MDVSNNIKHLLQKCKTANQIGLYVNTIFSNVIHLFRNDLKKDKNCVKECIKKFIEVYTTRTLGIKMEVEKLNEVLFIAIKYDNSSVLKRKIDAIYDMLNDYSEKINSFKTLLTPFTQTPNADPEVLKAQISLIKAAINEGILKDDDDKQIIEKFIQAPNTKC